MEIKDGVFLVTGGCSGLGAATARLLAARGAKAVALVDLQAPTSESGLSGDRFVFCQADVADEAQMRAAFDAACGRGELRGLFNCAGISILEKTYRRKGPHPLDSFEKVMRVNLLGSVNAARLAAEQMSRNEPHVDGERGVIVNTASIAAFDGQSGQLAYAASKGAIASMTLPMARDLSDFGIRVVTIAPGLFETPLFARLPDRQRRELEEQTPFPQRLGRPEEFAELALHALENRMLNGEVIRLDGGIRMGPR